MVAQEQLTLRLSQAEVVLLAGLLKAPYVPGLGEQPLQGMTEEQAAAALSAAAEGLQSRGYLAMAADGTPKIDEVVTAMVGACAFPTYSLVLSRYPAAGQSVQHFFHHLRGLTIEHTEVEQGVHRFAPVLSGAGLECRLAEILNLGDQAAPPGEAVVVADGALDRARENAGKAGRAGAEDALLGGGLSANQAGRIAEALSTMVASAAVVALDHQVEEAEPVRGFSLIEGAAGFWRLEFTLPDGEGPVRLQPVGAGDLAAALRHLAGPLASVGVG